MNSNYSTGSTVSSDVIIGSINIPRIESLDLSGNTRKTHCKANSGFSSAYPFAFSSATAIVDPWKCQEVRCQSVVTTSVYMGAIGIRISRQEALRVVRRILLNAEEERIQIAENEAKVGIQWENSE